MDPLEDGARSHCGLTPALLAGPAMTPIQPTRLSLTGRTDKTLGPAQLNQILVASVFSNGVYRGCSESYRNTFIRLWLRQ